MQKFFPVLISLAICSIAAPKLLLTETKDKACRSVFKNLTKPPVVITIIMEKSPSATMSSISVNPLFLKKNVIILIAPIHKMVFQIDPGISSAEPYP